VDPDLFLYAAAPKRLPAKAHPTRRFAATISRGDGSPLFSKVALPDERLTEESDRKEKADAQLQHLRGTLRGGKIPDSATERLVVWAKNGADSKRMDALIRVMDFITEVFRELGRQPKLEETIRRLLEGSPEAILQWEKKTRTKFEALVALRNELITLGAPGETNQRLIAWVVESGGFDLDRIAQISKAKTSLGRRPFSVRAEQQRWLRFLDETCGTTHAETRLSS
jgi:hypothetical protein